MWVVSLYGIQSGKPFDVENMKPKHIIMVNNTDFSSNLHLSFE